MRFTAKILALTLLLALKPACGGGGGGGGGAAGGGGVALVLPAVVPNLPLDASGATFSMNVNGMTDSAVEAAIVAAIGATLNSKIVLTSSSGPRNIALTVTAPSATTAFVLASTGASPRSVVVDGSDQITFTGAVRYFELQDEAQITLQRLKFNGARASDSGAVVSGLNNVRLATFINCTFTDCQTTLPGADIGGGAVRIANSTHTQYSNCSFTNCAGSNGGAINSLGSRLTIINCTFSMCTAFGTGGGGGGNGGIGGAVYVDNVSNDATALHQLSVTGCTFDTNHASDHAGALFGYTNPAVPSTSIIDRCTFKSNTATVGAGHSGAFYSQAGTLTLSNSTFNGNQASNNGGGIFCTNTSSLIANCTFQGNSATGLGGGISSSSSSLSLVNVTLAQNSAGNFAGALFAPSGSVSVQNSILSG
ncbi:MAG TPA: right-handed parallel beta-helix repeat-containing protein, partial [Planctomycetota bacterium]|nr:right-handed parallel beta-helix repeat-containing protein [Planctomycetota bacterium]